MRPGSEELHEALTNRLVHSLVILALVVASAVASLAAIAGELAVVKGMRGELNRAHVALPAPRCFQRGRSFSSCSLCITPPHAMAGLGAQRDGDG
jgi:hypothetical protein